MSRFKALQKMLGVVGDDAAKVLEKIDTPELATSLKGQERAEYLQALDEVYGNQAKRAKDLGFTENVYHGSFENFNKPDISKSDIDNYEGKGFYTTNSPEDASSNYAQRSLENYKRRLDLAEKLVLEKNMDEQQALLLADKIITNNLDSGMIYPLIIKKEKSYLPFEKFKNIPKVDKDTKHFVNADPGSVRSKFAAFDPRFKDSALLMAGGTAIPTTDISPMSAAKDIQEQILNPVVSRYNKLKSYITSPLAKQLDLTKDKSESKNIKQALDMGLDPINLIPGGAGLGAGTLQMLGEEDEEE